MHGRGGQGALTAASILAGAFIAEGKYATALPIIGAERRGAPVAVFLRYSDYPIRLRSQIYEPDCLLILDPVQTEWDSTFLGLKSGGSVILNSASPVEQQPCGGVGTAGVIDANGIAAEEIGRPIGNTCVAGAFAVVTGAVSLSSIFSSLEDYFKGEMLEANIRCAQRGWDEVIITQFEEH